MYGYSTTIYLSSWSEMFPCFQHFKTYFNKYLCIFILKSQNGISGAWLQDKGYVFCCVVYTLTYIAKFLFP